MIGRLTKFKLIAKSALFHWHFPHLTKTVHYGICATKANSQLNQHIGT